MNRPRQLARILALALCGILLPFQTSRASVDDLAVTGYELVDRKREGQAFYWYTFKITVDNAGTPLNNLVARVASTARHTIVLDGEVPLGNIGSGTVQSTDTFKFRQDRRFVFEADALVWTFTADQPTSNAPVIITSPVTTGSLNTAYLYDVDATDADFGDTLTYLLQQAPAGMNIDPQTGLITWLPAAVGAADVDVLVTDSTGLTDRQIYLVIVNNGADDQPPTLAPIDDQITVVGQPISLTAQGNDPEGQTLRYGLTTAPYGMAINTGTGELAWTPTLDQSGSFSATVTVSDPGGQSASASFIVDVLAETPNNPPVIDAVANRVVEPFVPVQITLTASDADAGDILLFGLSGAPSALQFDPLNGTVNWLPGPDDAGTVALTASVTDSAGDSDSTAFSITVNDLPAPPVARDDAYAVDRDAMLSVAEPGVLINDTDPNGDLLSAANTTLPALGSLDSFPGDGGFTYTPPQNPNIIVGLRERCRSPRIVNDATVIVGDIDGDGTVEIIGLEGGNGFTAYLFVMDGTDCSLKQPVLTLSSSTYGVLAAQTSMALANLDGDADLELLLVRQGPPQLGINRARLIALNFDGSLVWNLPDGASEPISLPAPSSNVNYYQNRGPTLADLNGDGSPEILMSLAYDPGVFDFLGGIVAYNADGTILWEFAGVEQGGSSFGKPLYVADLDLDGTLEVIYHTNVVDHNGNLEFNLPTLQGSNFNPQQLTVAIANFDNDPFPEIIARDTGHLYLFEHTPGPATWTIAYPNTARGEITVGDFDGDGLPEFAFHSGLGNGPSAAWMVAFDTDGSLLWSHEGTGYATNAGTIGWASTVFDYDQDGKDELTTYTRTNGAGEGIFILDGDDGTEVASYTGGGTSHTVLGSFSLFPTIADVDNDGAAEIVYPAATGLGIGPLFVLEGLEGNPLPAARPIRNQRIYQPTHVNLDGSVPAYPAPHWLIPGLNLFHGAAVIPFEDPGATDSFRYTASDATATSNEATVSIAITNVNPPVIVSRPPLGASPGFDYLYGVLATDADFGDAFTFVLADFPAGMTVDPFGLVSWTPDASDLGNHRVHLVVTDSQGNSDEQSFTIDVIPPVIVPDVVGSDESTAIDALTNAGLGIGSITQGYSLDVPAGEIISQSVMAGAESAAGAFINIVISLGPQPIFVPILADVNVPAAQSLLADVSLVLGSVTGVNSDAVPAGLVLGQSIAASTQVDVGTAVDITVSSGPAVRLIVDQPVIGSGSILPFAVTVFDNNGVPLNSQPAVNVSVEFEPGTVTGSLPQAGIDQVTTDASTSGGFTLVADAGAFGLAQAPFIVRAGLEPGDYFEPFANFADTLDELQAVYAGLVSAIAASDDAEIEAFALQLVALRDSIDLATLADRSPMAPANGFTPSYQQAVNAGFPGGFGELTQFPQVFGKLQTAINENRSFLERLDPNLARDDNIRARALNNQLESEVNQYLNFNLSVGALVNFKANHYVLLSRLIPELVHADLDATTAVLADAGYLPSGRTGRPVMETSGKPQAIKPGAQRLFFSIGGLMSASAIRMNIIKSVYVPYIKNLVAAGLTLEEANALADQQNLGELAALITTASQSFHSFNTANSVAEVIGLSADTRSFQVYVVGPDKYQAWIDLFSSFSIPTNVQELQEAFDAAQQAAADSQNGNQTAVVSGILRGCIFESVSECSQLVFGFGLPVVYSSGTFPAPVLIVIKDVVGEKVYAGVFAFFPN